MSWNTRNNKKRIEIGSKRSHFRSRLCVAWVRKHNPAEWNLICEIAEEEFPLLSQNGRTSSQETLKLLNRLERKTK